MSKYHTIPANVGGAKVRLLVCTACGEVLGDVLGGGRLTGLSAKAAAKRWPEIREAVTRHEKVCGTVPTP